MEANITKVAQCVAGVDVSNSSLDGLLRMLLNPTEQVRELQDTLSRFSSSPETAQVRNSFWTSWDCDGGKVSVGHSELGSTGTSQLLQLGQKGYNVLVVDLCRCKRLIHDIRFCCVDRSSARWLRRQWQSSWTGCRRGWGCRPHSCSRAMPACASWSSPQ